MAEKVAERSHLRILSHKRTHSAEHWLIFQFLGRVKAGILANCGLKVTFNTNCAVYRSSLPSFAEAAELDFSDPH